MSLYTTLRLLRLFFWLVQVAIGLTTEINSEFQYEITFFLKDDDFDKSRGLPDVYILSNTFPARYVTLYIASGHST